MRVRGLPGWAGQSLTQGGRVMGDYSEAYVGFDTSKSRNSVAIADGGRRGEVRFLGEIENTPAATAKLVRKLATKYERLTFCYEAGPTGYGLHRQIRDLGFECVVVAPSLIPKRPGDKVKTNRRDALSLAKLLAEIGELSRFRTPTEWMAYLGLVPSEDSTGDTVKRGPITKAGNRRARRMLVECSWSYQHPPRVGQAKQAKVDAASPLVREIAWKAQCRLYRRYRTLIRNGKLRTVAIVAIARELAGFIWAVARAVTTAPVVATPA